MAKVKTPKKEKIVDLKPKAEKITEEQLKQVQGLVTMSNKIKLELGNTSARHHMLLHELDNVNNNITDLNKNLEEEYGKIDVDINNGNIKYLDDEQADS